MDFELCLQGCSQPYHQPPKELEVRSRTQANCDSQAQRSEVQRGPQCWFNSKMTNMKQPKDLTHPAVTTKTGPEPDGHGTMVPVHSSWLTICAHHCPNQGQCPHTDSLLAHLHLAEEELHQLLGVGAGCRAEGAGQSRLTGSASIPALSKGLGLPRSLQTSPRAMKQCTISIRF